MFYRNTLENIGIEVTRKLNDDETISIVNKVSTILSDAYPNSSINYLDMYKILIDTPMYYAKIPQGLSKANYNYKDSSLYFAEDINLEKIDEYILHECIHRIQEIKDKKGKIIRFGVCEVNEVTIKALALNEGTTQYIVSNALKIPNRAVSVYNINFLTKTDYYPIITNLVSQIAYLLGDEVLIDSTINGNEDFKIQIIDNIGESEYYTIEKNLNEIIKLKKVISEIDKDNVEDTQYVLRKTFFDTQNIIYTSYFDKLMKRMENEIEIGYAKQKIFNYRDLIGTAEDYGDFEDYYKAFFEKADMKIEQLKNKNALVTVKDNLFLKIIRKIKKSLFLKQNKTIT